MIPLLAGCSPFPRSIENSPPHHTAYGYRNIPPLPPGESAGFSFLWRRIKGTFNLPEVPKGHVIEENVAIQAYLQYQSQQTITWLGHSTFLLKIQNKTLLLDPFLSDRASPLPVGPLRYVPPGISVQNLPPIDVVIISHSHYDHLDVSTLKTLTNKDKIQVLVPLGLGELMTDLGYNYVRELDWNQASTINGLKLTCLPAIHFSNRGLNDYNQTLWCSWAIESQGFKYYYAGDTAYSDTLFHNIGREFNGFDVAIMPIGAYEPAGIMQRVHTTPEEALQAGIDLRSRAIVPCHWGTIELSDEPHFEPPVRFLEAAKKQGLIEENAWVMKIGETRPIPA